MTLMMLMMRLKWVRSQFGSRYGVMLLLVSKIVEDIIHIDVSSSVCVSLGAGSQFSKFHVGAVARDPPASGAVDAGAAFATATAAAVAGAAP